MNEEDRNREERIRAVGCGAEPEGVPSAATLGLVQSDYSTLTDSCGHTVFTYAPAAHPATKQGALHVSRERWIRIRAVKRC